MRGRHRLTAAAAVACCALALPALASARSFNLGVTAGEIGPNSVRIWGHARFVGQVRAQVATDRRFRHVVAGKGVRSKASNNKTVQRNFNHLKADRHYFYRFCRARRGQGKNASRRHRKHRRRCSAKGTFETAPKRSSDRTIHFAYTGDTDATRETRDSPPFFGNFRTFKSMQKEDNDFNIHFGDTIYSDSEVSGSPPALTVKEKWRKYRHNLQQPNLTHLRKSAGFYSHWDDHEFINDFSIPEFGKGLYKAGVRAFRDYAPVSYSKSEGLYRTYRWGKNLELFFLDQRSFRSAKASANGVCDNPISDAPDLAPTAPPAVRSVFSNLIPALAAPVSNRCKNAINSPGRTMLGQAQFDRFLDDVSSSSARWKIVVNETPIQQFYGLPYDRWEGYAHERVALLRALEQRKVSNLVFITTDTHADFVNTVRYRTLANDVAPSNVPGGAPPLDTPYMDFITGPVATNPFWAEIDDTTGSPGNGELLSQVFFKPQPPAGVGMACAQGDQFSYSEVEVSPDSVRITYKTEDGGEVLDVNGDVCGPYTVQG